MDFGLLKKNIILDFDGTMCCLFQNFDLMNTKKELHEELLQYSIEFPIEMDTFDVFAIIWNQTEREKTLREYLLSRVHEIITKTEIQAAGRSIPIKGLKNALCFWQQKGYNLGVATNNSKEAVLVFLERIVPSLNVTVVGRNGKHPELMKPNTWSVSQILEQIKGTQIETIFIGDSIKDYECAKRVKCDFIGMAPTKKKRMRLQEVLDDKDLVSDYYELLWRYFGWEK